MNIYHIKRTDKGSWDTYSDAVVVAETENAARLIHPHGVEYIWRKDIDGDYKCVDPTEEWDDVSREWVLPNSVAVTFIGEAHESFTEACIICASYHAG